MQKGGLYVETCKTNAVWTTTPLVQPKWVLQVLLKWHQLRSCQSMDVWLSSTASGYNPTGRDTQQTQCVCNVDGAHSVKWLWPAVSRQHTSRIHSCNLHYSAMSFVNPFISLLYPIFLPSWHILTHTHRAHRDTILGLWSRQNRFNLSTNSVLLLLETILAVGFHYVLIFPMRNSAIMQVGMCGHLRDLHIYQLMLKDLDPWQSSVWENQSLQLIFFACGT